MVRTLFALLVLAASPASLAQQPPAATPPATSPAAAEPPVGADVVVVLKDGQVVKGRLVSADPEVVTLESSGARLTFPRAAVRELAVPGSDAALGPRSRDPNRTRYLYSPSGFMLRRGEGYVSQTELFITSAAIGVTDWLTLQAGTVLPVVVYSPKDTPLLLAAKLGGSPTPWLHVGAGFQTLLLPSVDEAPGVGLAFGVVTFGDEDLHLGISAGPPFAISKGTSSLGNVIVSVSGTWRVARSVALVTENWFLPIDGETKVLASGAVRFIGDRLGVDAGFLVPQGTSFPIPWLDFTWHWN